MMAEVKKPKEEPEEQVTLINPDGQYDAFGFATPKMQARLHIFREGKPAVTFQFAFLDVLSEGDNSGFWVIFRSPEKAYKVTVEGRNLWEGYDLLTQHRLPFIRELAEDRDFEEEVVVKGKKPRAVVNRVEIQDVTPKDEG